MNIAHIVVERLKTNSDHGKDIVIQAITNMYIQTKQCAHDSYHLQIQFHVNRYRTRFTLPFTS